MIIWFPLHEVFELLDTLRLHKHLVPVICLLICEVKVLSAPNLNELGDGASFEDLLAALLHEPVGMLLHLLKLGRPFRLLDGHVTARKTLGLQDVAASLSLCHR